MPEIGIQKLNNTWLKVLAEPGVLKELSEAFTFKAPGYKWSPLYKNRVWDGNIKLLNERTCQIYVGLADRIQQEAEKRGYEVAFLYARATRGFSLNECVQFIETVNLPKSKAPRDYQIEAVTHGIRTDRALFLSPTASGKSLMIYLLSEWYAGRTLIIVPSTNLVHQMRNDFIEYGCHPFDVHALYGGQERETDKRIVVGTWQTITKLDPKWLNSFDVVIGDEVHLFTAKSLKDIMEKMTGVEVRFGFTGTLDDSKTNHLVLEGLFGPVKQVAKTHELMAAQHVADLEIKAILLEYEPQVRIKLHQADYKTEMKFLIGSPERNAFIKNLGLSLKGNTMILFNFISHGKELYRIIKEEAKDKSVFLVYGNVEGEERNKILRLMESSNGVILIASYATLSTGANVVNLQNIVFASPMKSKIRNLQSIGRVLRRSKEKTMGTLIDIGDDLSARFKETGKIAWMNTTMRHFKHRLNTYRSEKFDFKVYNVEMKRKG